MRLIHSQTLQLHEFEHSSSSVPPYAILSHTWGDDEVTFRDMSSVPMHRLAHRKGFTKIIGTCRLAREHNLEYVWIDTCCIDKSSSAELSESINSMFKWYEKAAVCYVFLSDLILGETKLSDCRWWSRGWTLQELLAPENLTFYDATWKPAGTKMALLSQISKITGIEEGVLWDKGQILLHSVSQRMAWAASRRTTRLEDEAYCLLGIFGIHLPLLYGEGRMAFRRLQEEIMKRNADLTIFFWDTPENHIEEQQCMNLFAESPSAFGIFQPIRPLPSGFPEFFTTNKGVCFSGTLYMSQVKIPTTNYFLYGFFLGRNWDNAPKGPIFLRKIGPGIFCRTQDPPIEEEYLVTLRTTDQNFYIIADPGSDVEASMVKFRHHAFHIPDELQFRHNTSQLLSQVQVQRAVPRHLWDATDQIFLRAPESAFAWEHQPFEYPVILALDITAQIMSNHVQLIVLSEGKGCFSVNNLKLFDAQKYPGEVELLFGRENQEKSILQSDFRKFMPNIASLSNCAEVLLQPGNKKALISVSTQPGTLKIMSREVAVSDFVFDLVIV
ncbi:heterokaryon incompatibility protein-domain-containing protein [Xylaria sp. FL1042]|nr:heterokaryon incompatibility protein-domain-containing protein [Xylaria sp. FL1042]